MAVKECVECNEMVSEDAETCPHCGKKNPTETIGDKIGQFITGVCIVAVIMWWSPWSSGDKEHKATAEVAAPKKYSSPPVRIQSTQAYNSAYNFYYPKIIIASTVDKVTIKKVSVNKGNCKFENTDIVVRDGRMQAVPLTPRDLSYGENIEIRLNRNCNLLRVDVDTNQGSWSKEY